MEEGISVYMLHMHVQCMHRARAGQEEHSSQGTAQERGKFRPEISQKLGGQAISSSGSFGEGGKGFQNHRALRVKCVCFYRDASVYSSQPRTENKCCM